VRRPSADPSAPCVCLWIEPDPGYGVNVLKGIAAYVRRNPRWRIPIVANRPYGQPVALVKKQADGLIAQHWTAQDQRLLQSLGIPVVGISGFRENIPLPMVCMDEEEIGRRVARHFLELGLKNLACFSDRTLSPLRAKGFAAEASAHGVGAVTLGVSLLADRDRLSGAELYLEGLRRLTFPAGVFGVTDRVAIGVLAACERLKLRVPDEVAVAGCNNDEILCQITEPPLTSLSLPSFELGYNAAHMLDYLMGRTPEPPAQRVFRPGMLAVRESSDRISPANRHLAAALRFIREHAADPVYVPDVVNATPVSRRSLEMLFQEHTGRSIHRSIHEAHMNVAVQLARDPDLTIAEIAARSGFANILSLDRAFRRSHGCTAGVYRQKIFAPTRAKKEAAGNEAAAPRATAGKKQTAGRTRADRPARGRNR